MKKFIYPSLDILIKMVKEITTILFQLTSDRPTDNMAQTQYALKLINVLREHVRSC